MPEPLVKAFVRTKRVLVVVPPRETVQEKLQIRKLLKVNPNDKSAMS